MSASSRADDADTLQHPARSTLWALALLAVLVVASAAVNWSYHARVVDELEELEEQEILNVLTSKWTSGGVERSWTSTRGEHDPDETIGDLARRHKAEVAELMKEFPKDEGTAVHLAEPEEK